MSDIDAERDRLVTLTADIVSAYVSNNHVQSADLPRLLGEVHAAVRGVASPAPVPEAAATRASAGEIKRSVSHDFLISFEDGKPYKTLRRHLTLRGLSPEQYRAKWGLGSDYPMTSASYSEQRSELARALGLGQQRRRAPALSAPDAVVAAPAAEVEPPVAEEAPAAPEKKRRAPRRKAAE